MKRIKWAHAAACLGLFLLLATPAKGLEFQAKGVVLMDAASGRILFEQDAQRELPMASTTKIMTALITLEQPNLDEAFEVDSQAIRVEGSSMGLVEGDIVTLRALAAGMLLPSGNDAANAAAVRIAGSNEAFAELMNERAEEMGLTHTSFVTPSGLDAEGHYTSARDLALLAREALQNPDFAAICGRSSMQLEYGNPPYKRWLKNHNRMLQSYEGAIGVKTGFTDDAGRCLVSAAERDGVTLIAVTLGCPNDWRDHTALLDYGFSQVEAVDLQEYLPELTIPVGGGENSAASLEAVGELTVALRPDELSGLQVRTQRDPFVLAPARAGTVVGQVEFLSQGERLCSVQLCLAQEVPAREASPSFTEKIKGFFAGLWGKK